MTIKRGRVWEDFYSNKLQQMAPKKQEMGDCVCVSRCLILYIMPIQRSVFSFMLTVGVTKRRLLGGHVVKGQNVRIQGGVLTGAVVQAQVILSEMLH